MKKRERWLCCLARNGSDLSAIYNNAGTKVSVSMHEEEGAGVVWGKQIYESCDLKENIRGLRKNSIV